MPRKPRPLTPCLSGLLCLLLAVWIAAHGWRHPWARAMREGWRLSRMPAPVALPVPVAGVAARRVADTWGAARSGGRRHEGVDIFAARGTPVASTTRGVVAQVREGGLGGRQVWIIGPGGERHYYAHLEGFAPGLARFDLVSAGSVIGFVGDSGNARGTPPHLHYGVYSVHGARNPWPLLQAGRADRTKSQSRR